MNYQRRELLAVIFVLAFNVFKEFPIIIHQQRPVSKGLTIQIMSLLKVSHNYYYQFIVKQPDAQ